MLARLALLCLLALPAPQALAQTPQEQAQTLYREGVELFKKKDYKAARARFRAAYDLDPSPILLYNRARAAEELGDGEGAVKLYQAYLLRFPTAEDRVKVEKQIRVLGALLAKSNVAFIALEGAPAGSSITVDGAPAPEPDDQGRWKLEPGEHTVVVTPPEGEAWTNRVSVSKGETARVTYVATAAPPPAAGGTNMLAIGGYSAIGLGAVLSGLSAYFWLQADQANTDGTAAQKAAAQAHADQDVAAELKAAERADGFQDDIESNNTAFAASLTVGLVLVAGGVGLLIYDSAEGGSATLSPTPNGAVLGFTF